MAPWWKRYGKFFWVGPEALERVVRESGYDDAEIRRRFGYGYDVIAKLRAGERVSQMQAVLFQGQIEPEREPRPPQPLHVVLDA